MERSGKRVCGYAGKDWDERYVSGDVDACISTMLLVTPLQSDGRTLDYECHVSCD